MFKPVVRMTGPQHYAEAERLLFECNREDSPSGARIEAVAEALLADIRLRFDFGHAGTNEGRAAWRAFFESATEGTAPEPSAPEIESCGAHGPLPGLVCDHPLGHEGNHFDRRAGLTWRS